MACLAVSDIAKITDKVDRVGSSERTGRITVKGVVRVTT